MWICNETCKSINEETCTSKFGQLANIEYAVKFCHLVCYCLERVPAADNGSSCQSVNFVTSYEILFGPLDVKVPEANLEKSCGTDPLDVLCIVAAIVPAA